MAEHAVWIFQPHISRPHALGEVSLICVFFNAMYALTISAPELQYLSSFDDDLEVLICFYCHCIFTVFNNDYCYFHVSVVNNSHVFIYINVLCIYCLE